MGAHTSAARGIVARCLSTSAPVSVMQKRFAILELSGSQYKVASDDLICVEKLHLPVGTTIEAKRVLLVGEAGATVIGSPLVKGAVVQATVEEQGYGKKVIIFKKRRRKGYRRWKGYRSRLTLIRIGKIQLPQHLEEAVAQGTAEG